MSNVKYNLYLNPNKDKELIDYLNKVGNVSATLKMSLRIFYDLINSIKADDMKAKIKDNNKIEDNKKKEIKKISNMFDNF